MSVLNLIGGTPNAHSWSLNQYWYHGDGNKIIAVRALRMFHAERDLEVLFIMMVRLSSICERQRRER